MKKTVIYFILLILLTGCIDYNKKLLSPHSPKKGKINNIKHKK
jgi:hypothetical protein